MNVQEMPQEWDQALVRHVVEAKRDDAGRLGTLLRIPFPSRSWTSADGGSQDISILARPSGRWLVAARFAGESWVPLFSNAATANELFEANAGSRRLEVAWIGCRPKEAGWFFRLHRASRPIVEFAQAAGEDRPQVRTLNGIEGDRFEDGLSGEEQFHRLCTHFGISRPVHQIRAEGRKFQVIGARGKPVKTGLRGYVCIYGSESDESTEVRSVAIS